MKITHLASSSFQALYAEGGYIVPSKFVIAKLFKLTLSYLKLAMFLYSTTV